MIQRDGLSESLWQNSVKSYTSTNKADKTDLYDVIIVGGGITGVSTGLLLQEAGMRCIILEANNLCFGTTGGTTAHINTLLDTPYGDIARKFNKERAELVALSVKEAITLIRNNTRKYQIDCDLTEANAFLFARNKKEEKKLADIHQSAIDAGVPNEYTDSIPIRTDFTKAIKVPGQASFNPVRYVHGIAAAFEKAGGIIIQQCHVSNAKENQVIKVETNCGDFEGRTLIYATHIPPGVNLLHLRCSPFRSYAMAVSLKDDNYPDDLIYDMVNPYHYYRSQVIDGQSYLIGGGFDHKTGHNENAEQCFRQLEAHLREIFNVDKVVNRWSSQYYEPADGIPYIGHLPGHTGNIFTATGYGGNGIVYSHVAAAVLSDLITNKESPYPQAFNPNRLKPVAGFKNFIIHNADVARQLFHKWFSREELEQLAGLAPGEAKVVKYNEEKIALYKAEDGELHALHSSCTHMGCEVKWNNAELSWDCPCHGARYSYQGKVLNGPATKELTTVKLAELVTKT